MDKVIEAMVQILNPIVHKARGRQMYVPYLQQEARDIAKALLNLRYDCEECDHGKILTRSVLTGKEDYDVCPNCNGTGKGSRMLAVRKPDGNIDGYVKVGRGHTATKIVTDDMQEDNDVRPITSR